MWFALSRAPIRCYSKQLTKKTGAVLNQKPKLSSPSNILQLPLLPGCLLNARRKGSSTTPCNPTPASYFHTSRIITSRIIFSETRTRFSLTKWIPKQCRHLRLKESRPFRSPSRFRHCQTSQRQRRAKALRDHSPAAVLPPCPRIVELALKVFISACTCGKCKLTWA